MCSFWDQAATMAMENARKQTATPAAAPSGVTTGAAGGAPQKPKRRVGVLGGLQLAAGDTVLTGAKLGG